MKYLITGAAGFIASRTAEILIEQGHEVVGIDNLNDYYDVRLKTFRLHRIASQNGALPILLKQLDYRSAKFANKYPGPDSFNTGRYTFIKADIENKAFLQTLFSQHKFDAVLNLAARAGVRYSMINPDVYMTTNAHGSLNLLECMKEHKVGKIVLASTSSLYAGQPMPFVETMPVNEPISPYAATKKAAEAMAYTYHHLYNIDVSIVRYFTVYGPAGRPDMSIFRFIKWIDEGTPIELFGDGNQSRDFTYVDDVAQATIAAIRPLGYEIINVGGGNAPMSINDMIAAFEQMLSKKAVINHKPTNNSDMKDTAANIDKARAMLKWDPQIAPMEGFQRSIDWHKENRDLNRSINV